MGRVGCMLLLAAVLVLGACDAADPARQPATHGPSAAPPPSAAATTTESDPAVELPAPEIVWRRPGLLDNCCPLGSRTAVGNTDTVFVASGHDASTITALEAADGTTRWTTTLLDTDSVFVGDADDGTLLVHGQYGWFSGLAPTSGTQRWRRAVGARDGVVATTLLDGTAVLAVSTPSEGDRRAPYVLAVDTDDGATIWRTDLDANSEVQWGAPVVVGHTVLVQTTPDYPKEGTTNRLHALDVRDGDVRWQTDLGGSQGFFATPAVVAGDVVLARGGTRLHAVRVADGSVDWSLPDAFPLWARPDGATVLYTERQLAVVDATSGEATQSGVSRLNLDLASIAPVLTNDHAVVAGRDAVLAFDIRTGRQIWRLPTDTPPGALAITGNRVVLILMDGTVVSASTAPR